MLEGGLIDADGLAESGVGALATTRLGGVSPAPWNSLNLGVNTEDSPENLQHNRNLLHKLLPEGLNIQWLRQVHGGEIFVATKPEQTQLPEADICYTRQSGIACAVLTADCLPVLICDGAATEVAAAHAGWRGLAAGVLEKAVRQFRSPPSDLRIWLGPAISQKAFEVGLEVVDAMLQGGLIDRNQLPLVCNPHPSEAGKCYLNLFEIARLNLRNMGVTRISGGQYCTYSEPETFYSYRRDGETGRIASLIWLHSG